MISQNKFNDTARYTILTVISFLILQSLLILMHEFTHSTTAYLLGYAKTPLDIIWGNCIMMTGWDEGVHYHKLFPTVGNIDESLIGAMPLLVHTIVVTLGLFLLTRKTLLSHKWTCHILYWFIIANMMELIAYIVMRAFASGGDTGHFNHGLNISPWFLFIIGSTLIIYAVYRIFSIVLPEMYQLFAPTNTLTQYTMLILSAFIMFIWGSGLRIVLYIYPDPQWYFGLIGFAAFFIVIYIYHPTKTQKTY